VANLSQIQLSGNSGILSVEKHNAASYSLLESKLPDWRQLKTELELYLLG
jgi:hypothetical protein